MFIFVCWMWWLFFFFFKQKTAYEMRISDWSSDVCSSDLVEPGQRGEAGHAVGGEVDGQIQAGQRLDRSDAPGQADRGPRHALDLRTAQGDGAAAHRSVQPYPVERGASDREDRKSTRLNSSH